ncbi:hypothetical protein Tco_0627923, partial [Tanacetum coccineum]
LPRNLSDHCPLILKTHSNDYGPTPFKFFNSWLLCEDFPTILSNSWFNTDNLTSSQNALHPAVHLKQKLQLLKSNIRVWRNRIKFENDNLLVDLKDNVEYFDLMAENRGLTSVEVHERLSVMKQLEDLEHIKRLDLMQKSKIKWAIKGDENTKYFHGIVNSKLSRSRINSLYIDGQWISDPSLVTLEIFTFHKTKFQDNSPPHPLFTSNLFKTLSSHESSLLYAPLSFKEIKEAIWNCGVSKAPGLDEASPKNLFHGIKVGSIGVDVSLLQIADDALILGKWSVDNAKNPCRILRRNFFWEGSLELNKMAWISWKKICSSPNCSGL